MASVDDIRKPLFRTAGEGASRSEAGEGSRGLAHPITAKLLANARSLRRASTDAERRLWASLRDRRFIGYKFRRQVPIEPFIVEFACTKHLRVIEVDASQHANNAYDKRRTAWLASRGWRVLRFWDNEVLRNPDGVAEAILTALRQREALTLPRLRRGSLPLPRCGRGQSQRPAERAS